MVESDSSVIARSLREPAEFGALFERHFATIHRYLARREGADVADDLAAETFVVAFARRESYDLERDSALPWLYGIASNLLRAERRKRLARPQVPLEDAGADRPHDPVALDDRVAETVDAHREVRRLAPLLSGLSEDDVTTALLYAWEDMPYEQIAVALEIPVGTVRSRLHRVRRKLREPTGAGRARTLRRAAVRPEEER